MNPGSHSHSHEVASPVTRPAEIAYACCGIWHEAQYASASYVHPIRYDPTPQPIAVHSEHVPSPPPDGVQKKPAAHAQMLIVGDTPNAPPALARHTRPSPHAKSPAQCPPPKAHGLSPSEQVKDPQFCAHEYSPVEAWGPIRTRPTLHSQGQLLIPGAAPPMYSERYGLFVHAWHVLSRVKRQPSTYSPSSHSGSLQVLHADTAGTKYSPPGQRQVFIQYGGMFCQPISENAPVSVQVHARPGSQSLSSLQAPSLKEHRASAPGSPLQ